MIIDLHCHVAGIGAGGSGCHVAPRLRRNWRYGVYLRAFGVTAAELESRGDDLVFDRLAEKLGQSQLVAAAVILSLDGAVDERGELDLERTEVYVPGEWVARQTRRHSNLLYGASVNPRRRDALERLEQAAAGGAVLVKWLPPIQGLDPADPRFVPFYRKLADLGLPLLVHTGAERSFTDGGQHLGDPQRLRPALETGVTVIAAHVATTGCSEGECNMERLLAMLPDHPNLFADISSLTQLNKLVYLPRLLRRPEAFSRLLYGTDMPLLQTPLVSPWYFLPRIGWRKVRELQGVANPWDRDVRLKLALGVPPEVFTRGAALLKAETFLPQSTQRAPSKIRR